MKQRLLTRSQRLALLAAARVQQAGAGPDPAGTVEVETTFGRLLLPAEDEVITPTLVATGGWEPGETALLGARLRPGMTVLDGGAHAGYFTCLAARLVGPRGLVLAFEPNPRTFELLLANVWRNGFANVAAFNWALGAESGFAELFLSPENTGDNRLTDPGGGRSAVRVRTARLDEAGVVPVPLDVVKLDLQGAERPALAGMEGLLRASPGVLVVTEFWPAGLRRAGTEPTDVLAWARSLGFTVGVLRGDEREPVALEDDAILAHCAATDDGEGHVNLVLERRPGGRRG